jgi:hypothetical protein
MPWDPVEHKIDFVYTCPLKVFLNTAPTRNIQTFQSSLASRRLARIPIASRISKHTAYHPFIHLQPFCHHVALPLWWQPHITTFTPCFAIAGFEFLLPRSAKQILWHLHLSFSNFFVCLCFSCLGAPSKFYGIYIYLFLVCVFALWLFFC